MRSKVVFFFNFDFFCYVFKKVFIFFVEVEMVFEDEGWILREFDFGYWFFVFDEVVEC